MSPLLSNQIAIVYVLLICSFFLLKLLRPEARGRRWSFSAKELGTFSYARLALVSSLGLFLELLLIRWVSSEIRVFAYFKNFVLIACFLGFGLGCYLYRRRINLLPMLLPLAILVLTIQLPWESLRDLITDLPTFVGATSDVHVWELPQLESGLLGLGALVGAILLILTIFSLLTFAFIPVGQLVGWYLNQASRPIAAYTINILGSLAGI